MPNIDSDLPTNLTTVADVLDDVADNPALASLADVRVPMHSRKKHHLKTWRIVSLMTRLFGVDFYPMQM